MSAVKKEKMSLHKALAQYKVLTSTLAVAYPGRLGDWYTGLGAQTLVPKKHFSSFLFAVVFHQKIC